MADRMSSSGDEVPVERRQRAESESDDAELGRKAQPVQDSRVLIRSVDKIAIKSQASSCMVLPEYDPGYSAMVGLGLADHDVDDDALFGHRRIGTPSLNELDQRPVALLETDSKADDCDGETPDDADFYGFNPADTGYIEDWENEPHSGGTEEDLEENGPLVSEYEIMQMEYDAQAADESSDEEEVATAAEQISVVGSHPNVDPLISDPIGAPPAPGPTKRNYKIQPFPMTISHRSLLQGSVSPGPSKHTRPTGESKLAVSRLSPKFISRPVRRIRPSPFAALLKKRGVEERSDVSETDETRLKVDELEDDIESWSG